MSAIILACSPAECEKIANGNMSILVRKKVPNESNLPIKVYIYCMKSDKYLLDSDCDGSMFCWDKKSHHYPFKFEKDFNELFNGKVIGEFVCNKVDKYTFSHYEAEYRVTHIEQEAMCLNHSDLIRYGKGKMLYGLHITALKIYDKPKELSEFRKPLDRVYCSYYRDYCEEGCVGFGSTDYVCNDYWNWKKGLTRPPKNYIYVEEQENKQ